MNIISGIAKGIRINVPNGLSVRPTGVMARKSLFDSLRDFDGFLVVDLFAGTGALGLEAASRGASEVYFVENDRRNCRIISDNIERVKKAGVETELQVINTDVCLVHKTLSRLAGRIDLILADPPYADASFYTEKILNDMGFANWAGNALFVFETPSENTRKPDFDKAGLWNIKSRRKLGQSVFYFLSGKETK